MIDAEFLGQANLLRQLAQAGGRAQGRVKGRAEKLANEMAAEMRRRVPKDEGDLEASIRVEPGEDGTSVILKAGDTAGTTRRSASGGHEFDTAILVNYGTLAMPANPFFTSVVDEFRERIASELGEAAAAAVVEVIGE